MNKFSSCLIIAGVAVAAASCIVWIFGDDPASEDGLPCQIKQNGKFISNAEGVRSEHGKEKSSFTRLKHLSPLDKKTGTTSSQEDISDSEFTVAEQKIVDAIQTALDDDNLSKVAAQLKGAAASNNAAVRAKAIEALQWFGAKALPELTMFMADPDDEVRAAAIDAYTAGLSQMEAGEEKATAVCMGLQVITDRDQLEAMVMQVDDLVDFQKLDVLTRIIEGENNTAAEVAREHYKFWTEEDYTNLANAQKWLENKAIEDGDME